MYACMYVDHVCVYVCMYAYMYESIWPHFFHRSWICLNVASMSSCVCPGIIIDSRTCAPSRRHRPVVVVVVVGSNNTVYESTMSRTSLTQPLTRIQAKKHKIHLLLLSLALSSCGAQNAPMRTVLTYTCVRVRVRVHMRVHGAVRCSAAQCACQASVEEVLRKC